MELLALLVVEKVVQVQTIIQQDQIQVVVQVVEVEVEQHKLLVLFLPLQLLVEH